MSKRGQGDFERDADKKRAFSLTPVSCETQERLEIFVALLLLWQKKINLVAESTLPLLWSRHISDSLQLIDHAPDALVWADYGSGAGFPGIPIACALADKPGALVHLIESVGKKANFLREAVRVTRIPAVVHQIRAENFGDSYGDNVDVVTARALSPLKTLCDQSFPLIERGALGIFPKGQDVDAELTEAAKYWTLESSKVPSKTSPEGNILLIRGLKAHRRP
ncbi:MAG: 16S rRNA (guanine(527)-N(7))-methyltransferase RsmG [Pseudolabrys sp.]|nr:16S rRNA (guanine(527)-N(7))-methyltransferase RsmG [Pseudolabrys sp.]MSP33199.1 16S rRNA (guanine(527)-N(7))-methyltransferase RsmG [Pseudolabrys sp.]